MMGELRHNVRPVSGNEMRALYAVLLNARSSFHPLHYHCFRKFVKVAFDLGSVSVYEQEAIGFFIAAHQSLRLRMLEGPSETETEWAAPLAPANNPKINFYAPKLDGGYQDQEDAHSDSMDIHLEEIDSSILN